MHDNGTVTDEKGSTRRDAAQAAALSSRSSATRLLAALRAVQRARGTGASILVLSIALAFATPALAAAPEARTEAATEITAESAVLNGAVNAEIELSSFPVEEGTYQFSYLATKTLTAAECESGARAPVPAGQYAGVLPEPFSEPVSGLKANTDYIDCLLAEDNAKQKAVVAPVAFETAPEAPEEEKVKVGSITASSAELEGVLNPKASASVEPGEYQFLYKANTETECAETAAPETPLAAAGNKQETVAPVKLTGLQPGMHYAFCLREVNAAAEQAVGAPVTFTTLALAPTIESEFVTNVASSGATLRASINAGGASTAYHFEYGTSTSYGTSAPIPDGDAGRENVAAVVSARIPEGLTPGTTYHYRAVASNEVETVDGPDQTFTTQGLGGAFTLPDGRQYELVSPPQKDGAEILGIGGGGETPAGGDATQASEDGASVTYIANAPVTATPPGSTFSSQIFSTRGSDGWSSQDIAIPHANAVEFQGGGLIEDGEEYRRFSSDLSRAIVISPHKTLEPSLAPEVKQEVRGGERIGTNDEIYLRENASNVFRAVLTDEPLPIVYFEGASPDLSHVVFRTEAGLDPEHPGVGGLFEWVGGRNRLVDVLPSGVPASGGTLPDRGLRNATSSDGERVVWSGEGGLFTRDMTTGETVQVDAVQGGGGASGGGTFQTASGDGSRVFFTDGSELTSGAHEGGLYMFEPGRTQGERLTDLTPAAKGVEVQSFVGASEDGTALYFISSTALPSAPNGQGEGAKAGASNLYVLREAPAGGGSWSTTFITAGAEEGSFSPFNSSGAPFAGQEARVSPNGRYLAFMSKQSLTGYDNIDANPGVYEKEERRSEGVLEEVVVVKEGKPVPAHDEEVYLYDAEATRLVCASCDPTGARPVGEYNPWVLAHEPPIDANGTWGFHWLAAMIPGWTPNGDEDTTGYQPRFLSDSGRLFFNSVGALVPGDANGKDDVYQYEPAGLGSCQSPSYGQGASVVFSKAADGCVGLISAGTGGSDSIFFDASANGSDVFFTTGDELLPQDRDGVSDLYDAHECTAPEPCTPLPAASPPACTIADSCRAAPPPQPAVFGPPPSATFVGAGNVAPTPPSSTRKTTKKAVRCAKGFIRQHSKCIRKKKRKRAKKSAKGRK